MDTNTKEKTPVIEFKDFQFQYFSQAKPLFMTST